MQSFRSELGPPALKVCEAMFDHLQFYLVGGTVCTALVSAVYIPTMRGASLAQKMTATALAFAILAVIAFANWGRDYSAQLIVVT